MVLSALYFLDRKGRVLISRDYRGDIPADSAETFMELLTEYRMKRQAEQSQLSGFDDDDCAGNFGATDVTAGLTAPPPVLVKNGIGFCFVEYNNLFGKQCIMSFADWSYFVVLGVSKQNFNVMLALQFLHRVIQVFKEYFFELEEESLRDNFVLVYELLDEMMDFGYPQLTESKILKEYITQKGLLLESGTTQTASPDISSKKPVSPLEHQQSKASSSATGAVSWRPDGIKYRKNEVFLDVIEAINLTVNSQGQIIKNEIAGRINIRCYLSGMPELRLGLNDKVLFDLKAAAAAPSSFAFPTSPNAALARNLPLETTNGDAFGGVTSALSSLGLGSNSAGSNSNIVHSHDPSNTNRSVDLEHVKFHQCVRLTRFEQDRTIAFIPPDGEFELLSYRVTPADPATDAMKPLFWVDCVIEKWSDTAVEYLVTVKSQFKKRSSANGVELIIPVPVDADTPRLKTTIGSAEYAPELSAIKWFIGFFPGSKEFTCRVKVGLPVIKSTAAAASLFISREGAAQQPPITVSFELPYYTMSGIQVRYLKIVEKSGYAALPWVRYITQSCQYHFRMPDAKK